jgi:hypothetical protein
MIPTKDAPTSIEQLKELLKDDNKVKVAGMFFVKGLSGS